jgi:hypothetical protein
METPRGSWKPSDLPLLLLVDESLLYGEALRARELPGRVDADEAGPRVMKLGLFS